MAVQAANPVVLVINGNKEDVGFFGSLKERDGKEEEKKLSKHGWEKLAE